MGRLVVAKKTFSYAGKQRDIGEVFELVGMRNDEVLWGASGDGSLKPGRYTEPFKGSLQSVSRCDECGAMFDNVGRRDAHYLMKHGGG